MKRHGLLAIPVLILIIISNIQTVFPSNQTVNQRSFVQTFWRTELYFGRDKNDGTFVSDDEWSKFLDVIVTPRFPDGFTVLDGYGQYRLANGTIIKENSKVLILLYTPKTRTVSSRKVEQIRNEYKKLFKQESVMRIDLRQTVNISF